MLHWRDITIYTETEQSLLMILCSLLCFQSDVTMTAWQSLRGEASFVSWQCWRCLPLLSSLYSPLSCPPPVTASSPHHPELHSALQIFAHLPEVNRLSNNLLRFAINNLRISQKLRSKPTALLLHLQIALKWSIYWLKTLNHHCQASHPLFYI